MRCTEELKREHIHIKIGLRVLEQVAARLDRGDAVPDADIEGLLEFLSVYADKCHHAKEEDCLFPLLEKKGMPREGGPIGMMLEDHVVGRGRIAAMREAVAARRAGKSGAGAAFAAAGRAYVQLLTDHISKEDDMLFPMADETITREDDRVLAERYQAFELERIGAGRHEALEAAVAKLEAAYCS